jgi:threonine dehydratase
MKNYFKNSEQLDIDTAIQRIRKVVNHTPLAYNINLSKKYDCNVYLKREDLQIVRSYKIRGAYNKISSLSEEERAKGVVCASAGNHAQGFAYSCCRLGVKGHIFMPFITPKQKISMVRMFGEDKIELSLIGDTFDDCQVEALKYTKENEMVFIPPFDDYKVIEGQGTIGFEILDDLEKVDYLFVPVGGGGLASGLGYYFKEKSPETIIIGAEPLGAPSMTKALEAGHPVSLSTIEKFVDGAAVKKVGEITFEFCRQILDRMLLIPEGKICSTILQLYNEDAIVVEPAGALSISALDSCRDEIKGKNVVCVVSGSNNDIDRMQEIKERSLLYEGLKHYFIIRFPQRAGALKDFVNNVLGPSDDITRFEYMKKHEKEAGPALVGIELKSRDDYDLLVSKMDQYNINFTEINNDQNLFDYLV